MDVHQVRDLVLNSLEEPVGKLGCAICGQHDTFLSMSAGVITIEIDGREFEVCVTENKGA